ncbi:MAG: pyridoxamine 5'-phosphate oxidase family protein [Candidatus Methanoplasma sp.]|jgi:predicted pyridoxine 5'-phosphate oxidase superfamily flavin-nucleotide-binding protein|nr:pyridoxamine 5'-phosphate oxidase family protein [Candidatus Methanoplasma sp.]
MAKITDDMKAIFGNAGIYSFATASKDGIPNVVPIGMLIPQPDGETVWVVDNFMDKTISNVKENPNAAFYIWDPKSADSYQIKGTVTVENSGDDYEKTVKYAHERKETLPAKNLLKMKITDIYYVTPGPKAGKKV